MHYGWSWGAGGHRGPVLSKGVNEGGQLVAMMLSWMRKPQQDRGGTMSGWAGGAYWDAGCGEGGVLAGSWKLRRCDLGRTQWDESSAWVVMGHVVTMVTRAHLYSTYLASAVSIQSFVLGKTVD